MWLLHSSSKCEVNAAGWRTDALMTQRLPVVAARYRLHGVHLHALLFSSFLLVIFVRGCFPTAHSYDCISKPIHIMQSFLSFCCFIFYPHDGKWSSASQLWLVSPLLFCSATPTLGDPNLSIESKTMSALSVKHRPTRLNLTLFEVANCGLFCWGRQTIQNCGRLGSYLDSVHVWFQCSLSPTEFECVI